MLNDFVHDIGAILHQNALAAAAPERDPALACWVIPYRDIMGSAHDVLTNQTPRVGDESLGVNTALTLLVQAYRHCTGAVYMAQRCYSEQGLALARASLEACQMAELVAKHPDVAEGWWAGKTGNGKEFYKKWGPGQVRAALDESGDLYSFLCGVGAHPRKDGIHAFAYAEVGDDEQLSPTLHLAAVLTEPQSTMAHSFVLYCAARITQSAQRVGLSVSADGERQFRQGLKNFATVYVRRCAELGLKPHPNIVAMSDGMHSA